MKKKIISICSICILILIVTIIGIAYAKYVTTLHGRTEAKIAQWSFKVNGQSNENFTINLADTRIENQQQANVEDGFVGPGTSGVFKIIIDGTGSEVSLGYDINMDIDVQNNEKFPKNLIFYSDDKMKNAIYHGDNSINLNGYILQSDTNKVSEKIIYWKWDYETGSTDEEKTQNDMIDSKWMGKEILLSMNVNAKQVAENPDDGQYEVTFDLAGGSLNGYGNSENVVKKVNYGDVYGDLPVPTRDGYKFLGWNGKNMLNLEWFAKKGKFVKVTGDEIVIKKTDEKNYFSSSNELFNLEHNEMYSIRADIEGKFTGRIYGFFGVSFYNIDLISDEVKITNIQVEKGNQSTEYEPFYVTNSTKITQNKNHTLTAIWEKI